MGRVWRAFAWDEIQNRYRRSVLGIAWIAISYVMLIGAISVFFASFSNLGGAGFTLYFAIGYLAFNYITAMISDGCMVFRSSATWIKSTSMPYSVYVFKSIARSLVPFAIQFSIAAIAFVYFGGEFSWRMLLAIPAFGVYVVNGVWIQYLFGLMATRFRDIQHLVAAITRILFFVTPIIWVYAETSGIRRLIADYNPLTYFIDIFRAPLLGQDFIALSWPLVAVMTAAGWAFTIAAAAFMRRRLPFWL